MPKHSLTVISLAVLFGGLATIVPSAATAAPAGRAPQGALSVQSTVLDVTTTTGRHLQLQLGATHGYLDVYLAEGSEDTYGEEHDWSFDASPALRFDRDAGKGTVQLTSSDLHRFGRVDLKVRQTRDWTAQDCTKGGLATTRVHIKGTLVFRTRSTGDQPWGNVGTATEPLAIDTHGRLFADDGCQFDEPTEPTFPCEEEVFWGQRSLFGASFTFDDIEQHLLGAIRFRFLPHTNGEGMRFDSYFAQVAEPVFTTTDTGVQVEVTGSTDGRVTGSATLAGQGTGERSSAPCGSESGTMTVTDWNDATLTNGADPLTLHPDLGAPIVAHAGSGAFIEHSTPDPAPTTAAA